MKTIICLKNDRNDDIVGFCLFGIYLNLLNIKNDISLLILDNSKSGMLDNPFIRTILELIYSLEAEVIYDRIVKPLSIGGLQKKHYERSKEYDYLYWLDSDIFLNQGLIDIMINTISKLDNPAFLQGSKIDITPRQNYFQDINVMNNYSEYIKLIDNIYFGDTSNIIIPISNLDEIDWGIVSSIKDKRVITGTDTLITSQLTDKRKGYGLTINGFHLSFHKREQKAEIYADWLRIMSIKNHVSLDTIKNIYKEYDI